MKSNKTEQNVYDITKEKLKDLSLPGFIAEFTPEEADLAGAFIEDALTENDAMEASYG